MDVSQNYVKTSLRNNLGATLDQRYEVVNLIPGEVLDCVLVADGVVVERKNRARTDATGSNSKNCSSRARI